MKEIYVAPGNAGTAKLAQNLNINATDIDSLVKLAKEKRVDLTVVGPEAPLAEGIADGTRWRSIIFAHRPPPVKSFEAGSLTGRKSSLAGKNTPQTDRRFAMRPTHGRSTTSFLADVLAGGRLAGYQEEYIRSGLGSGTAYDRDISAWPRPRSPRRVT